MHGITWPMAFLLFPVVVTGCLIFVAFLGSC